MWFNGTKLRQLETELQTALAREEALKAEVSALRDEIAMLQQSSTEHQQAAAGQLAVVERMSAFGDSLTNAQGSLAEMANLLRAEKDKAIEAAHVSHASGQATTEIAQSLSHLATESEVSAHQVENLAQRADEISTIVKLIHDVADQTNLLALNAAIEAARAGEQGRGFAVVADEVRKLAERTTQSTQEIASTILEMQAGAQAAVHGIHAVVEKVDEGVSRAEQANEAIQEIGEGSRKTVDMVGDISDAIREQSMASTAIAQQVEKIAQMSEENSAAAQSTSDTAGELAHLAQEMQQVVAQYRL